MAVQDYTAYIQAAAQKYGVDPAVIAAMINQESSGNPNAASGAGAQGLMQLEPGTASDMGVQDVFNPAQNIDGGTKYYSQLLQKYGGDSQLAMAAYNDGPGNIDKLVAGGKGYDDIESSLPPETQNYVAAIQKKNQDDAATQQAATNQSTDPSLGTTLENKGIGAIENYGEHKGISAINSALGEGSDVASTGASQAVGSTADGGVMLANGETMQGVGSAANGGITLADGSVAGGSTAAAGTPGFAMGTPSYAGYISAAMSAYNGIKNFNNVPKQDRATYAQQQIGLAVADVYTGGIASMGEGFARSHWGGTMSKIDSLDRQTNPMSIAMKNVWGGKGKDQTQRDAIRKSMQGVGFLDPNFDATLADGSKYDFGADGNSRLSDGRRVQEADFKNPLTPQTVGWTNAIGAILGGGDTDRTSYWAGYLSNAAESNASTLEGSRQNVLTFMKNMGLDQDTASQGLLKLKQAGTITNDQYNAYAYGLGTMFSGKYNQPDAENAFQANKSQGGSAVVAAMKPNQNVDPNFTATPTNGTSAPTLANEFSGFSGDQWMTMPEKLGSAASQIPGAVNDLVGKPGAGPQIDAAQEENDLVGKLSGQQSGTSAASEASRGVSSALSNLTGGAPTLASQVSRVTPSMLTSGPSQGAQSQAAIQAAMGNLVGKQNPPRAIPR